jgi:hypothetical protein
VGVVVKGYRKPEGDDARLVAAFERIAVLPGGRPADHAEWMARWRFRGHPHVEAIVQAIRWTREFVDFLAEGARHALSAREQSLRAQFLRKTELALGERVGVRNTPLRVARMIEQTAAEDFVDIALEGDRDALYQAFHEAGWDALDWVWVRRTVEAWRVAVMGNRSHGEYMQARDNLVAIGPAIARGVGSGRVRNPEADRERKDCLREARPALIGLLGSLKSRKELRAELPDAVRRAGITVSHLPSLSGKLGGQALDEVADDLLAKQFGLKPSTVRRYAAQPRNPKK